MEKTKVHDFVQSHRVGVLAMTTEESGVHAATMHYAEQLEPLELFFLTDRNTKKCEAFARQKDRKAAVVIGFSEEEWTTMQMEGEARLLENESEIAAGWKIYGEKFPERVKFKDDEESVLIKFTPSWWKYSVVKPEPEVIESM